MRTFFRLTIRWLMVIILLGGCANNLYFLSNLSSNRETKRYDPYDYYEPNNEDYSLSETVDTADIRENEYAIQY